MTHARRLLKRHLLRLIARRIDRGDLRFLFVVSHMRSGSTLLVHILNTSRRIVGYGETHTTYRDRADLARLTLNVARSFRRPWLRDLYVLDKLLFEYVPRLQFLVEEPVKLILLVRRPEESLPSILRFRPGNEEWDEARALEYYVGRLESMARCAEFCADPARTFALTYDQLIGETTEALPALGDFLGLDDSLSERYDLMWSTGRRRFLRRAGHDYGIGDDSDRIRRGLIVRGERRREGRGLSTSTMRVAGAAYEACLDRLASTCTALPGRGGVGSDRSPYGTAKGTGGRRAECW